MNGLHAAVTGGGSGIGAAVARALAKEGARVTILGRSIERLLALELAGAHCVSADVADPESVSDGFRNAVEALGPIDILVNNAGQAEAAPFARTTLEQWQRTLNVNLTGAYLCTQQVIGGMSERGFGRVVNIASTAALKGYAYVTAYCAAKHGVLGLTRALALEVARRGVTVNAVCPGYTETEFVERAVAQIRAKTGRTAEQARAELVAVNPQGRLIQPEEVAQVVVWLCRPAAASVTGQAIAIAGGEVM
jgi:3-hydroxybutyrate dehydrogenase